MSGSAPEGESGRSIKGELQVSRVRSGDTYVRVFRGRHSAHEKPTGKSMKNREKREGDRDAVVVDLR
jgi:hypothetical protein